MIRFRALHDDRTRVSVLVELRGDEGGVAAHLDRDLEVLNAFAETRGWSARPARDTMHRHHLPARPGRLDGSALIASLRRWRAGQVIVARPA